MKKYIFVIAILIAIGTRGLGIVHAQTGPVVGPTPTPIIKPIGTAAGYGSVPDTTHAFEIILDPELPLMTTTETFVVAGSIKSFVASITPNLAVAYGFDKNNLTQIASNGGAPLFNSPLNIGDAEPFISAKIPVASISKNIQNNTIYFAVVDKKNPSISYTGIVPLELNPNDGKTTYSIPINKTTLAPSVATKQNGGLLDGICTDVHTCGFADLLKLFTNVWKFILILVIPLMALMTAWIGFNFMQQGAEYREKAKEMAGNMIKGVILIIFAWFIVNTILTFTLGKNSCYSFLGKGKIDPECQTK